MERKLFTEYNQIRGRHCEYCCCSVTKSCLTLHDFTIAHQLTLSTLSWGLFRFMSIETVMLRNHLNPCCPIMLLASVFLRTRVFSNELALHIRRLKYSSNIARNTISSISLHYIALSLVPAFAECIINSRHHKMLFTSNVSNLIVTDEWIK